VTAAHPSTGVAALASTAMTAAHASTGVTPAHASTAVASTAAHASAAVTSAAAHASAAVTSTAAHPTAAVTAASTASTAVTATACRLARRIDGQHDPQCDERSDPDFSRNRNFLHVMPRSSSDNLGWRPQPEDSPRPGCAS
jgi:hypothetical protein